MNEKEPNIFLDSRSPQFSEMIRSFTKNRFESISGLKNISTKELTNKDDFVYGTNQSMIIVAGNNLKLTFKSHFMFKDVGVFLKKLIGSSDLTPKNKNLLFDTFREHANLTAGGIKTQLEKEGMLCGISLPIISSGFDEIVTSDILKPRCLYDYFKVESDEISFIITICLDSLDLSFLDSYEYKPENNDDDDDYDFL